MKWFTVAWVVFSQRLVLSGIQYSCAAKTPLFDAGMCALCALTDKPLFKIY